MSAKYKEQGGGAATGLSDDFVKFLSQGLNTGTFGAGNAAGTDAFNTTGGMASVLNDILSGGAGKLGGSLNQLITNDTNNQVNDLRARFGVGGGTGYGTGAQYAESNLRAQQAPKLTEAIGGLQMGAVQGLLSILSGLSQKGIAQRSGTMEQNPWVSGIATAAPFLSAGLDFFGGNRGMSGNSGGPAGYNIPNSTMPPYQQPLAPGQALGSNSSAGWTPTLFDYGLS